MAGPLDLLADMFREYSDTQMPGDEGYLNLAQANHYTSNFLIGGKTQEEMIQTSQRIRRTLFLAAEDVGQRFGGAGVRVDYKNLQIGTEVTAQMSFYLSHIGWSELEEDFGEMANYKPEAIRVKFNDIIKGKHQNMHQACADVFEAEKWAPANQADMRTNYMKPMSIPYFVTEQDDELPLEADGSSMTDVLGLSPATHAAWKNGRYTYGALGGAATDGDDLLGGLTDAAIGMHWEPLPIAPEFGVMESAPNVVFCSNTGLKYCQAALRAGQDRWGRPELGNARGLVIGDMMIRNVSALNGALLYEPTGGGALVDETTGSTGGVGGTGITGPRFYGVTKKVFQPVYMKGRYMAPGKPTDLTQIGAPIDNVQVFKTYNQLVCWDRSKQFILSPSATL